MRPPLRGAYFSLLKEGESMRLNGEEITLEAAVPLLQILDNFQYDPAKIAVERNGDIIPKSMYHQTEIQPDDCLEFVSFVGGG